MVTGMETVLAAMIGFVGALLSALLVWIRSDIKALRSETNNQFQAQRTETNIRFDAVDRKLDTANTTLKDHGERIARIEGMVGVPAPPPERTDPEGAVAARPAVASGSRPDS